MKKNGNSGMTLIEILVVLAVLGILSGFAGLRLNWSRTDIHGSSSLLQTHLWFVKQRAITTRQRAGLVFNLSGKKYQGIAYTVDDDQINPFDADPLDIQLKVSELETNLDSNTILFDSRGRPVRSNGQAYQTAASITLRAGEKTERIVIEPVTGYIHN